MSKADRLRGMTDEEMAEYLAEELGDGIPTDFLAWLREKA